MDDFEVEVSDLRTGQVLKTAPVAPGAPALMPMPPMPPMPTPPAMAADGGDFEVEVTALPAAATQGTQGMLATPSVLLPVRRRQMYGAAATGALIVVVLVAILGGVVSRNGLTFGLFPTPVPTATLAVGADTFYMVNAVPWGKLLADGNVVNVAYSQQGPVFFHLPIGRHAIEYDAAPFPRVRCTVSVPAASSDTCPLYTSQDPNFLANFGIIDGQRGIDFGAILAHLPPDQMQALTNAAEQSLSTPLARTTVPVGGRYQGANGEVLTAAHALNAQVFLTLNTDPNFQFGQNCISLCDLGFGNGGAGLGGTGWAVLANTLPMWRYTDSSTGTTMELPGTPKLLGTPGQSLAGPYSAMVLSVSWTGAWQVTPLVGNGDNPGCFGVDNVLFQTPTIQTAFPSANGYSSTAVPAPNPADGCLMAFAATDQQNNPVGKQLRFLYRFGLLFAANPIAHKIVPQLPVAVGSEAQLVTQLASQLQPPWNG